MSDWDIIDFHAHIRPPSWQPVLPPDLDEQERALRHERTRRMTSPQTLMRESAEAGVGLRLLSATIEGFFGTTGKTDIGKIREVNDFLAGTQAEHSGQLAALATIDAFSGEEGAREAERAIKKLGHVGIVIDSARDDLLLSDSSARPTLELANALKVPVLVHPVGAPNSDALTRAGGVPAYSFGRGLINGAAFLSLLRSEILDELPDLNLVFTAIGAGALIIAAAETVQYATDRRESGRKPNIYFDIMGLDPAVTRFLVDFLGADRVLVGSDWPIWAPVTRTGLRKLFETAGLTEEQQRLIASGNARRLLDARSL